MLDMTRNYLKLITHSQLRHMEESMEKLLTPNEVADITGLSKGALAQMRYLGRGPAFQRLSAKAIRYSPAEVERWLETTKRTQTGQRATA